MPQTSTLRRFRPPAPTRDIVVLSLTRYAVERISGVTTTTFTLANEPSEPVVILLNGRELDRDSTPAEYTVNATRITLSRAAVAADVFMAHYHYRTQ